MAIKYSLICWGGKDGKTVSISASTDVVTLTRHGVINGHKLYPSGTLPAELSVGTPVYARSTGTGTFTLHTSSAGALANTGQITFAGSSTYAAVVLTSFFWQDFDSTYGPLYGVDKTRYGSPGAEFCYDSYNAWLTAAKARHASADLDTEICEVGEAFDDYTAASNAVALNCAVWRVESKINGQRTWAYHNGLPGTNNPHTGLGTYGYGIYCNTYNLTAFDFDGSINGCFDGLTFATDQSYTAILRHYSASSGFGTSLKNNIVFGFGGATAASCGIRMRANFYTVYRNIVFGFVGSGAMGFNFYNYNEAQASYIANNQAHKNNIGFNSDYNSSVAFGYFLNNQSVGNTTNWGGTAPSTSGFHAAANNAGEKSAGVWTKGTPWYKTTDYTGPGLETTDYNDYNNNDFSPKLTSSPQVDAGVAVYGMDVIDLAGNEVAAYNNGGAETWDVGAFEKNLGYSRPEQHDLVLTVEAGYDIKVFTAGDAPGATPLDSDSSSGTTYTYPAGVAGVTVDFTVQKLGKKPVRFTNVALDATETAYEITLETDLNYVTSSGLTWGTNFTYDTTNKYLKSSAATSGRNLYSALIEAYIAQSALNNAPFDFEMNGPGGLVLKNGVETRGYSTAGNGYDWNTSTSTLYKITDDGVQYKNTSGTVAATFASITTTGIPAGVQGRFQQADGSGTTNFRSTGDVNQLVQVYGDGTHGSVSALTHFVSKVQAPGYDEAAMDAVATYGDLEGQGYIVPLLPVANGIADASGITGLTYTDHGASPVTWHSKVFSITITDTTDTHTGEQIIQWIRHNNTFNYHDLVQKNGSSYKTVRGAIYGDTGATLKGVRVVRSDGSTGHYDFDLFTADDGTTYSPPVIAALTASAAANTRFVLYNVTQDAEIDNVFAAGGGYAYTITTEADVDDTLDLHYFTVGKQEGRTRFTWGGVSTTVAVEQTADAVETALATELGITGADVTEFDMDVTGAIEVDADDADGSTQKARLALWYKYILTTEDGARYFRGGISLLSTAAIRINVSAVDIKIENVSATKGLFFTDTERRLYRSDGTSIVVAASQPGSIENDYNGVPDTVETGVSGLTGAESAAILDIAGVKAKTDSLTFNGTLLEVDMKKTNGTTIKGDGTIADKFRSTLVA